MSINKLLPFALILCLVAGCTAPATSTEAPPTVTPQPSNTPAPTHTPTPTPSPEPRPTATPTPQPAAASVPAFEEAPCPFEAPQGYDPVCGYLTVLEDRSQPDGRTIHLAVAIFESTSPNPAPDPVIHLAGGPGSSPLNATRFVMRTGGNDIVAQRDYILFDQRGVGYSDPNLYCPPYDEYLWDAHEQDLSLDEYNAGALPYLEDCLTDWQAQGIDMAAYNSAENAADVNDLRLALGYDQVNLYGTSYGSRLALTVMRDYPEAVRSVIIDAVYPPESNLDLEIASSADRALDLLFSACAESESCTTSYGDLEAEFYATVDRLEASPVVIEVSGSPYRDSPYQVYLDGDLFIDTIFGGLYSAEAFPDLPGFIQAAYDGRYAELAEIVGAAIGSSLSTGMMWSTFCREEIPFEIDASPVAEADGIPLVLSIHFTAQYAFDVCELWDIPAADATENEPVISDIPTLIFAGQHDPITPPQYAELAAESLSHHYYYLFPNMAHGVMRSDPCALQIGLEFLDDPAHEPDASCVAALSEIAMP